MGVGAPEEKAFQKPQGKPAAAERFSFQER
jgi:hypothetical protein